MRSWALLHIPHASVLVPAEERETFLAGVDLEHELRMMTDWYTDELFDAGLDRLVFPVSRLVCDVERFRDDRQESMSRVGMGAVYSRCHDLKPLRTVTPEKREALLRRWYDPHHLRLTDMTEERLRAFGRCLIVDCHSFPAKALPYERDRTADRPEICIGTDPFHTPPRLAEGLAETLDSMGYRVGFDTPFSGCLVPLRHYCRDSRVQGIMIEINRGLYLDRNGNRSGRFPALRRDLERALHAICASQTEREPQVRKTDRRNGFSSIIKGGDR